ncbi:MAG TPA: WhiB family transcriptional regulator [Acidimicrobiales bacterium]|nr:WhiB family transcriptional regulator [Acidimicrobiales bacterium]
MALHQTESGLGRPQEPWREHAKCRWTSVDFFPVGAGGPAMRQLDAAKTVCRRCPVAEECLAYALATNQQFGVWGATSEQERRRLRRVWLSECAGDSRLSI